MAIYPAREAQIALLVAKEFKIPSEYLDFLNVFLEEKALILLEATELNQHAIKLQEGQQPPYGPIYSLGLVELEILKTYIKTNLANSFIRPSKSLASALQRGSPNWISPVPIIKWGLRKATNKRQLSELAMAISSTRLSNAPASIQNYINKILAKKLDIFVIVYQDDIFIYTKDPG